jgi:FkbM family methyltransferase
MRRHLKNLVPAAALQFLREAFGRQYYAIRSYAQEGEDILLLRLFDTAVRGIYVDIGAHHPYRFSNTQLLYERGWCGINIDARPGSMNAFRRRRPRDINLEVGVSRTSARLEYHVFEEPALNTFDPNLARVRRSQGWPERETQAVECLPLATLLERELPRLASTSIDLLSVDVEGLDLEVLQSNDWARFRPRVVVAEILNADIPALPGAEMTHFLDSVGYRPYAKLVNSIVFLRADPSTTE